MIRRLTRDDPRVSAAQMVAGFVVCVALGALGGALVFQYGLGLPPCPLCIDQRLAHGAALVSGLAAMVLARQSIMRAVVALILADAAFVAGAGISLFHAGVEYHWWRGPTTCSGTGGADSLDALRALIEQAPVVRCDEAPWSFLGISMAGYDFVICAGAAGIAAVLILGVIQWGRPGPRRRPWRSF